MHFLENYYNNIIKYDLINRFNYKSLKNIPELKKIVLNFGCKTFELKKLSLSLLALQLVAGKKGVLTVSKKPNVVLKIREGNPVGCKVVLTKSLMYSFFTKLLIEILPKLKKKVLVERLFSKNALTYSFDNTFVFKEIENNYLLFNSLKHLQITLLTNTENTEELIFLLNSLKIIIKLSKCNSIGRV